MPRRTRKISKALSQAEMPHVTVTYYDQAPDDSLITELREAGYEVAVQLVQDFMRNAHLDQLDTVIVSFAEDMMGQVQELLVDSKRKNEHLPIICIGPVSRVEDVVSLIKQGAYDCLESPAVLPKLLGSVSHAIENYKLTKRVSLLESQVHWEGRFDELVGISPPMQEIFHMVKTVAKSSATVLILGESGTGKELVAKALHRFSTRSNEKFIDINCGAIPRELLENELFGHERGSYTGADRQYIGTVERSNGGTLFLDEIGEMDVNLQVKLLRLLQERTFQRIGGSNKIDVDIRIIAATNRDLRAEVDKGSFREELYYRLNVVPIMLPPLRQRTEDIPLLAKHFLDKFSNENHRKFKDFTPQVLQAFVNYDWPGNVRELENTIERVVVLHDDSRVKPIHLPRFIQKSEPRIPPVDTSPTSLDPYQKIVPLALVEQNAIESTLSKCNGDVVLAAKKLQIGQATLYRKLKRYGIKA